MQDSAVESVGFFESTSRKWQYVLDKLSPQLTLRWVIFGVSILFYFLRVYLVNGWYIVTYGLGIYLLNQLIGFLSPQVLQVILTQPPPFANKCNLIKIISESFES